MHLICQCHLFEKGCSGGQVGFKDRIHVSYCSLLAEEVTSEHQIFLPFVYSVHVCPYCFASYCHIQLVWYKKFLP